MEFEVLGAHFGREAKREHLFCFLAYSFLPSAYLDLARVWICMCMVDLFSNRECQSFGPQLHHTRDDRLQFPRPAPIQKGGSTEFKAMLTEMIQINSI